MQHDVRVFVLQRLRHEVRRRRLTHVALSLRSGVSVRTVERVLAGDTCGLETVAAISQALRIDWDEPTPAPPPDEP